MNFTKRWLSYYQQCSPFFELVIADGSEIPTLTGSQQRKLSGNIQYLYEGPDIDIATMIKKIKKASDLVRTEFTVLSSNDDFYILNGLARGVKYLQNNPEWIASMGIVRDFSVIQTPLQVEEIYGKVHFGDVLYKKESISEQTSLARASRFLQTDESFWHAVFRSQALNTILSELQNLKISDLIIYEKALNLKAAQIGKLHRDHKTVFMLHQVHPQMEAKKLMRFDEPKKCWIREFNSMLIAIFKSSDGNGNIPTYDSILLNLMNKGENMQGNSLRLIIQKFKFKFASSRFIGVINRLDPFTARIYLEPEVRAILKFLRNPRNFNQY